MYYYNTYRTKTVHNLCAEVITKYTGQDNFRNKRHFASGYKFAPQDKFLKHRLYGLYILKRVCMIIVEFVDDLDAFYVEHIFNLHAVEISAGIAQKY